MIVVFILGCEIAFWMAILIGMVVRYPMRRRRLGLASVPLIDLALLLATAINLRSGATAGVEHGLAAIYIGFSLAYGHRLIHWADVRFAHRFAGGPAPERLHGAAYTRLCWGDVLRTGVAAVVGGGLTAGLIAWVGDPSRTAALGDNYRWLAFIFVLDLVWAVSTVIWPRRAPRAGRDEKQGALAGQGLAVRRP